MLKVFLDLKPALKHISQNTITQEFKSIYLNSLDWLIIKELTQLFNIFVKLSVIL